MIIDGWIGGEEESERHANGMILLPIENIETENHNKSDDVGVSYGFQRSATIERRRTGVRRRAYRRTTRDAVRIYGTTGNASDGRTISADRKHNRRQRQHS